MKTRQELPRPTPSPVQDDAQAQGAPGVPRPESDGLNPLLLAPVHTRVQPASVQHADSAEPRTPTGRTTYTATLAPRSAAEQSWVDSLLQTPSKGRVRS